MTKYKYFRLAMILGIGVLLVSCQDSPTGNNKDKDVTGDAPAISKSVTTTTQNVYKSDENVLAYDHILPTAAESFTDCKVDGGLSMDDKRWTRTVGQKAYNTRPKMDFKYIYGYTYMRLHAFEQWHPSLYHPDVFGDADWINATDLRKSNQINPTSPHHNWSRYEMPVNGNGSFELKLLADNCSWIYLDDKLVGYQDETDVGSSVSYGVELDGPATLTFLIYDSGGDAGGKFRMQTTTNPPPPLPPLNSAPVANAGPDQTLKADGSTTSVTLNGSGSDDADGDELTYNWSGAATASGETPQVDLAVGTHTFTLTVTDEQGATDSDEVTITVEDTTPPELTFTAITGSLWPPNHKMVAVASGIQASDNVDGVLDVTVAVSSNEPSNGRGDGNTDEDYEIRAMPDGSYTVYVRSERRGKGSGRTYTITMSSTDAAGNTGTATHEVSVEKSKGKR